MQLQIEALVFEVIGVISMMNERPKLYHLLFDIERI